MCAPVLSSDIGDGFGGDLPQNVWLVLALWLGPRLYIPNGLGSSPYVYIFQQPFCCYCFEPTIWSGVSIWRCSLAHGTSSLWSTSSFTRCGHGDILVRGEFCSLWHPVIWPIHLAWGRPDSLGHQIYSRCAEWLLHSIARLAVML